MPIFSHRFTDPVRDYFKKKSAPKPQPLVIHDALGTFTMKSPGRIDSFEGEVTLLGKSITVFLETDGEGKTTANAALQNLHTFAANAADWDARIKAFAADDFAEADGTIETWGGCESDSEGETLTKEVFMRRIEMNFIQFFSDGSIFLDYDLDDMYTDHGLAVHASITGTINSCALWG